MIDNFEREYIRLNTKHESESIRNRQNLNWGAFNANSLINSSLKSSSESSLSSLNCCNLEPLVIEEKTEKNIENNLKSSVILTDNDSIEVGKMSKHAIIGNSNDEQFETNEENCIIHKVEGILIFLITNGV